MQEKRQHDQDNDKGACEYSYSADITNNEMIVWVEAGWPVAYQRIWS